MSPRIGPIARAGYSLPRPLSLSLPVPLPLSLSPTGNQEPTPLDRAAPRVPLHTWRYDPEIRDQACAKPPYLRIRGGPADRIPMSRAKHRWVLGGEALIGKSDGPAPGYTPVVHVGS
jgi:hypothetical protein